jgi:beta-lactamase class A
MISIRRIFFGSFFFIYSCNHPKISIEDLKEQISEKIRIQPGNFAVAFEDVQTGSTLLIHEHEPFHAASTMKTPVMIELYRQADAGTFSLSDSLLLKNEFRSIVDSSIYSLDSADDSDSSLYRHQGEKRRIGNLIYLMITKSSNLSTNLLVQLAGAKNVTTTMESLGAGEIKVLRGVEDNKAFQKGLNNTITAYGLMKMFEKMAKQETVSGPATKDMIRILEDQTFNEIIPAKLPREVKVAHKTGWFKGVNHDSGIVFLPGGRKYVLVLLSKNIPNDPEAVKSMAEISEMIYRYMTQKV